MPYSYKNFLYLLNNTFINEVSQYYLMTKLICLDMDGVIFKDINFWLELHKAFGTYEQGFELTKKYLHTDYNKLVYEVVQKLWKGKDAKPYFDLINSLEYLPGVKEFFEHIKKQNYRTAIISASSIDVARRVQRDYDINYLYANELIIEDNKVSGEFVWPIAAGKEKKAEIITHLAQDLNIPLKEITCVGDSDMDVEAFKIVGLAIAFNSSSKELQEVADIIVDSHNLADVIDHIL